jgi:hypothetical protein
MFQETVFAQIMDLVDHNEFNKCVERYDGDKKVKEFKCHDQFLCMIFSQLAKKRSLRDTVFTLGMMKSKLYHMGIRGIVNRCNLANANERRNWRIYHDYAQSLIKRARELYIDEKLDLELKNTVYAIDSTTIDLCLSVYEWAEFRSTKSGIKLHTVMDLKGSIPTLIDITEAIVSDNGFIDKIEVEKNAIYIMNRGYCDFKRFNTINQKEAYFVTRLKRNVRFRRLYSGKIDKSTGLIFEQVGVLDSKLAKGKYPEKVRTIKYYDSEHEVMYLFLTNSFELDALTVCKLYKQRWQIELFFKWIKQNLYIERFFGQSENAVKLQIWIAICAYLLIVIFKRRMSIKAELSQILHFLSNVLFERIPIQSLFSNLDYKAGTFNLCTPSLQLDLFTRH